MKELIHTLAQISAPSGYENPIRQVIQEKIAGKVDHSHVDALGNLIADKGRLEKNGLRIMLVAHMDEIGIIATHIDPNGFVRFSTIGGVKPINCVGGRVQFTNGVQGVIGIERMRSPFDIPSFEQMFIDVGVSSNKECPIKVGDVAAFDRPPIDIGHRIVSKALDDRVGVAILIKTIEQMETTPHQVHFVFSVQEEVGVRGATTASFGIDPDLGLAVDVTGTGDTPNGLRMETSLGKGPAIKIRDAGMLADPRIVDWMINTAKKAKIPYQREILEAGGTDARAIQLTRSGVPAGCLSIPCRYIHSPSEMIDLKDVENAVLLLVELIKKPINLNHA